MNNRRYGGFWRRYFAYLIDKIILYLVLLFFIILGALALGLSDVSLGRILATGDFPRGLGLFIAIYTVATFIIDMIYFTWFHGSVGQTPGKMLLGLRVIQATGDRMTFGVAFLRWVGSLVSGLFLSLGYLWIAIDGRKRGWHDLIAATLVIRTGNDPDEPNSPDAAAQTSPDCRPAAQESAGAGTATPLPPPTMHDSADAGAAAASLPAVSASGSDSPAGIPAAPSAPAGREAADPAGGASGDLPGRG